MFPTGVAIRRVAFFVASGVGATGLTVVCNVYAPDGTTHLVTNGACVEIAGGGYSYTLAQGSNTVAGDYLFIFSTAGTADVKHVAAVASVVGWLATAGGTTLAASQTTNITGNITGNLSGSVGSVTGAVGSVTGNVGGNVAGSVGSVTGLTANAIATALLAATVTEGYSAEGDEPTLSEILTEIAGFLMRKSASGTTLTVKDLAGGDAMTFTLNSATAPTSITRAS